MKIVKCSKVRNHFYDADKYDSCPYCKNSSENSDNHVSVQVHSMSPSEKHAQYKFDEEKSVSPLKTTLLSGQEIDPDATQLLSSNNVYVGLNNSDATQLLSSESMYMGMNNSDATQLLSSNNVYVGLNNSDATQLLSADSVYAEMNNTDVMQMLSHNDRSKPMGVSDSAARSAVDELTVGWLAVKNARIKGKIFTLKAGRNTIGNGSDANVSIDSDISIKIGLHAVITYDEQRRSFSIEPMGGMYLVWLNGDELLSRRQLNAYDIVSVGNTDMIFVPLCGKHFSWKD